MRWKEHDNGDVKIERKFALFPIKVDKETRWLEWVTVKYVYHSGTLVKDLRNCKNYLLYGWVAEEFID